MNHREEDWGYSEPVRRTISDEKQAMPSPSTFKQELKKEAKKFVKESLIKVVHHSLKAAKSILENSPCSQTVEANEKIKRIQIQVKHLYLD